IRDRPVDCESVASGHVLCGDGRGVAERPTTDTRTHALCCPQQQRIVGGAPESVERVYRLHTALLPRVHGGCWSGALSGAREVAVGVDLVNRWSGTDGRLVGSVRWVVRGTFASTV